MSLEVLLIPLGIAAYGAWRESRSTDLCEKCQTTRLTDQRLLVEAIVGLGAARVDEAEGRVTGTIGANTFTFQRVGEVFLGRIDGADEQATASFLSHLESRVGSIIQARNVELIRTRAAQMGLNLVSEVAADGSVQLVFEERA